MNIGKKNKKLPIFIYFKLIYFLQEKIEERMKQNPNTYGIPANEYKKMVAKA